MRGFFGQKNAAKAMRNFAEACEQINSMEDFNDLPTIGEEMETNIPIYRAKKIDSDEYIEGFYSQGVSRNKATRFATTHIIKLKEINPSTLAIHFPDMIDSEGTKIFASLSEDGKGGDILIEEPYVNKWVVKYGKYYEEPFDSKRGDKLNRYGIYVEFAHKQRNINDLFTILNQDHQQVETNERVKVTGIQE